MTINLRLLPATLAAVGVLLGFKTVAVWQSADGVTTTTLSIPAARAEPAKPEPARPEAGKDGGGKDSGSKPVSSVAAKDAAKDHGKDGGKPNGVAKAPEVARDATSSAAEAPSFSTAEVEVLQQLGKRREALEARSIDIDRRETMLKAAETRIDEKAKELEALRGQLEGLIKGYDEQHESKIRSLVKIYENMKPVDAAQIFEELEMDTLLLVAERMKERKLAPVMAEINPTKAKEITEQLAKLKELLSDKQAAAGRSG